MADAPSTETPLPPTAQPADVQPPAAAATAEDDDAPAPIPASVEDVTTAMRGLMSADRE